MNDWDRILLMQEHCEEIRRFVQNEHLAKLARGQEGSQESLICRALCGLGRGLTAIGAYLQKQYGAAPDAPARRAARPGTA